MQLLTFLKKFLSLLFNLLNFCQRKLHRFIFFFYYSLQQPLYKIIFLGFFYFLFFSFVSPYPIFITVFAGTHASPADKLDDFNIFVENLIRNANEQDLVNIRQIIENELLGRGEEVHVAENQPSTINWKGLFIFAAIVGGLIFMIRYGPQTLSTVGDFLKDVGADTAQNIITLTTDPETLRHYLHQLGQDPSFRHRFYTIFDRRPSA